MKEYNINPSRAMLLYNTGNGWEIAKLNKYALCIDDHESECPRCFCVVEHSLFYRAHVPDELLKEIQAIIPTDEQLDDIEWCNKHQTNVLDYGADMCKIHIEH